MYIYGSWEYGSRTIGEYSSENWRILFEGYGHPTFGVDRDGVICANKGAFGPWRFGNLDSTANDSGWMSNSLNIVYKDYYNKDLYCGAWLTSKGIYYRKEGVEEGYFKSWADIVGGATPVKKDWFSINVATPE
jgi:hypothetical protein